MGVCDNSWGLDQYQLIRVPIKCASNGYYLRWWYSGWHYWFFLPGDYSKVTEGENYRTIGTRKIKMSSGQITSNQAKAIRTILNTREVYLLTVAGWMNIRLEPGTINIFDNRVGAVEIEITAIIGSKEISYTSGYSPIAAIPVVAPDTPWCEIVIGTQVWMCRNFDSDYPGSKVYNNDEANRNPYGGLYTWAQVMSPGFCPAGWHVPTSAEWADLINEVGTLLDAGGILKEAGFVHWNAPNTGATDGHGFAMVGSGYFVSSFLGLYEISNLWTADEFDASVAFFAQVSYNSAGIAINSVSKNVYLGVRLIRDTPHVVTPYSDYFLPSLNELIKMYTNISVAGGFDLTANYWSSTEGSLAPATAAQSVDFSDGSTWQDLKGNNTIKIRACRTYISSSVYSIGGTGQSGGKVFEKIDNGDGTFTYWEAAPTDLANAPWSNVTAAAIGTTLATFGEGPNNTAEIIAQGGHVSSAAKDCDDLIVNY